MIGKVPVISDREFRGVGAPPPSKHAGGAARIARSAAVVVLEDV
jgi:hypothetical protein